MAKGAKGNAVKSGYMSSGGQLAGRPLKTRTKKGTSWGQSAKAAYLRVVSVAEKRKQPDGLKQPCGKKKHGQTKAKKNKGPREE